MFTTALTTVAMHGGPFAAGFGWIPLLVIPLFWIAFFTLLFVLLRRRGRGPWGPGPWAQGGPGNPWAQRSAEQVLAERFARGDIDETEYRARLEVLRS
ncbi:SHOCT domain-containing protein [Herbiconiux sp. L3-i23]|uniref:SHOCT domain-containing protein n=1 Tax=Herbiconiux sp. L3-i23 TaxID=2905871 RepID=UPI002072D5DF|nr:SHOCT domain-containing protein [Herbiconiux sp. L3-i23]